MCYQIIMIKEKLCIISLCYVAIPKDTIVALAFKYDVSIFSYSPMYKRIYADNDVKLYSSIEDAINENVVFIIPAKYPENHIDEVISIIYKILNANKYVWSFSIIPNKYVIPLKKYDKFNYCVPNIGLEDLKGKFETQAPIIYICGNNVNTSKNIINLLLTDKFEKFGTKVVNLSNNEYSSLLGQTNYPADVLNVNISLDERKSMLIDFLLDYDLREKPDLYIMTIPHYESLASDKYGIPDIFRLIDAPEYLIFCLMCHNYTDEEIEKLVNFGINGKNVDYFFLSDNTLNLTRANEESEYELIIEPNNVSRYIVDHMRLNSKLENKISANYSEFIDCVFQDFLNKFYMISNVII